MQEGRVIDFPPTVVQLSHQSGRSVRPLFSRQNLENLIGSGSGKTVSKVHRSCVCWKTLKDYYTLNLKAKLVFFGFIMEASLFYKVIKKKINIVDYII